MSTTTLGLSCPAGGKFYICDKAVTRFIGCCAIDPCGDGTGDCPIEHLKTSSFSSDAYANIPAQSCAAPSGNQTWFTCSQMQPPFMGCCGGTNPCQSNGCPQGDLLPAKLSDVEADAQVFLDIAHGSTGQQSSGPPLGAIIGAAVGGAVLIALIVGFIAYRCGWFARRRREEKSTKNTEYEATKLYDATSDGGFGGLAALHSGTYPGSDWPEHERLRSESGSPAPQYSSQSPGFAPYSPGSFYNKRYSDVAADTKTLRDSRSHGSPVSAASPFPVSPGMAPHRTSSQTYGNISHISGSYDSSFHPSSPQHSRNTSDLTGMLPYSAARPLTHAYGEPQYTAMELDASEYQRPGPVSELPSHNY